MVSLNYFQAELCNIKILFIIQYKKSYGGLNLPLGQTSTNTSWAEAAANYYIQFLIFKKNLTTQIINKKYFEGVND